MSDGQHIVDTMSTYFPLEFLDMMSSVTTIDFVRRDIRFTERFLQALTVLEQEAASV